MIDADEIARLRDLCERATDGPWEYAGYGLVMSKEYDAKVCHQATRGDAEFIAAARDALPKLLDEVERLQHAYPA